MYTYQQTMDWTIKQPNKEEVIRWPDGALIPFDPDNIDYQQYQEWLAAGNTPSPPNE